jgi:hypothetical protein
MGPSDKHVEAAIDLSKAQRACDLTTGKVFECFPVYIFKTYVLFDEQI